MNKSDILVQLSYHLNFLDYGGLSELKKKSNAELMALLKGGVQ